MSKIRIEGDTTFPKEVITNELVNIINGRLMTIEEELRGIEKDLENLRAKHGMDDRTFLSKFENGDLGDDEDFFVWESSLKLRDNLEDERRIIKEAL